MNKSWLVFIVGSLVLAAIFFLLPINIFNGIIEYENGSQSYQVEVPLSLSYFIGLGFEDTDMEYVKGFHLTATGILMAVLFIFGFPALLAYRLQLKK